MSVIAQPLVILGIGGNAQEVAWIVDDINQARHQWHLLGFVDTVDSGRHQLYGRPVLGNYAEVASRFGQPFFACGMGLPAIREKESQRAQTLGWRPATLIHPSVIQAKFVCLAEGATVAAGSILGPCCQIGRHCFINTRVVIGHDAKVGDFSVISPSVCITGGAVLEENVFIGANASVHPKCRIGKSATLAANSFLQADLAAGESAIGVPAKVFFRKPKDQTPDFSHHFRHISR